MIRDDVTLAPAAGPSSPRSFGLVFAVVFAIIASIPMFDGAPPHLWAATCALVLLALALLRPAVLALPNRLWLALGSRLHIVMSLLILGVLFYAVVTPFALLLRACGRERLNLGRAARASYWTERDAAEPAASFDKPY